MTDEAQDMAVAIALGWTWIGPDCWADPFGKEWQVMHGWNTYKDGSEIIPRYGSDLNACHEMEKFLTEDQIRVYVDHLSFLNNAGNGAIRFHGRWACASADASQRREAFLRTLNLYTD
jgi:hypothetical protein